MPSRRENLRNFHVDKANRSRVFAASAKRDFYEIGVSETCHRSACTAKLRYMQQIIQEREKHTIKTQYCPCYYYCCYIK